MFTRRNRDGRSPCAALELHILIVKIFGGLAAMLSVLGCGLAAFSAAAAVNTVIEILGIRLSTASVGVAFMAIGLIVAYLAVKCVLKSQKEIAQLPESKSRWS
jgi:hypothetical protein